MFNENECFRLTHAQMGIWYTEKMHPGTSISNIAATLWFADDVDFSVLEKAFNLYIQKNAATRISIIEKNTEPLQYISKYTYKHIELLDLTKCDAEEISRLEKEITRIPFKIIDSELFNCAMIKTENKGGLYLNMHHLISDAWTMTTVGNQIALYYYELTKGIEISEEENPSYLEFVKRESEYLESEKYFIDKEFWNDIYYSIPETIGLEQKKSMNLNCNRISFDIPEALVSKISIFCSEIKTSAPSLFMALVSVLLFKLTSKSDFVLGTLVLNRANARDKKIAGVFINTLPVRININDEMSFSSFVNHISKEMMRLYRHGEYPYNNLISNIREKNRGFDSLYEVLFSYQNAKFTKATEVIKTNSEWHFNSYQKNPLSIHFNDRDNVGKLIIDYDYRTDSFSKEEILEIHDSLLMLISKVFEAPNENIGDYNIMPKSLLTKITYGFNETDKKYDLSKTIHQLFEEQVSRTPDNIAVVFADSALTYRQLNEKSNQLARKLREYNIGPDFTVGLYIKRSLEMVIGILAILKAGGAYLPIDPDFPEERISYILSDSSTKVILTQNRLLDKLTGIDGRAIDIDNEELYKGNSANLSQLISSSNLAYVLYTSGSTGKPKGVMLEHRSVVNFICSMKDCIDFATDKTILSLTTMSFDIFFLETILPLTNGQKVVIANEEQQKIPRLLSEIITVNEVDMLQITPSRLSILLSDEIFSYSLQNLSEVLVGGEALQKTLVEKLKKATHAKIYNMYGPTETTIWSTYKEIIDSEDINIGKPIANTSVYVLDKKLRPLPIGVKGMLYIGGSGLARGYLNKDQLTNEKFIPNPFIPQERMYCTGDVVKWLPEGELQYIGREDNQLKVNGYRIELGEIDACLLDFERIKEAVTIIKDVNGDSQIYAYYVADADILPTEIRNFISATLPTYMIPSHFIRIESIPLTPNGKIDRNTLVNYESTFVSEIEFILPRNDIEKKLMVIWNEILGDVRIGINDNLLVAGADSLSIISAISKIFKEFKVEIPLMEIYKSPTIKEIGEIILFQKIDILSDNILSTEMNNIIVPLEKKEFYPLSSAQKRIFILQQDDKDSKNYNIPWAFLIEGNLDIGKFEKSFRGLVRRHEVLRTGFDIHNEEPVQIVFDTDDFDMTLLSADEASIDKIIWDFIKPFDLKKPPLVRLTIVELTPMKRLLLFDMHHIISDGESIKIMLSELNLLYKGQRLNNLDIQYRDYSVWQKDLLKTGINKVQEDYWMSVFSNEIPILNLPLDYMRSDEHVSEGDRVRFNLGTELTKQVFRLTVETGSTLYMVLLSAYYILLYRYTGQDDIVIGSPIAGRTHEELKNIVGMFVNTLALRNYPKGELSYLDFLSEVKENTLKAFENQNYQFEELVSKLKLKREPGRNPLFDTMFSLQNFDMGNLKIGDLNLMPYEFEYKISKFDILLEAVRNNNDISLNMDYCAKLFNRETVERMAKHYVNILNEITTNREIMLDKISILSKEDLSILKGSFDKTKLEYGQDKTINEMFEEQVLKTPDNVAVVFNGAELTYNELNKKANVLARVLRTNGIGNDCIVGIMINRSLDMPVAIMSVLKAGGAFVPIDPNYPQERIKIMLEESKASTLITQTNLIEGLEFNGNIIAIDALEINTSDTTNLTVINNPSSLIYVIFTSGSTGRPKGVMLEQKNIVNLINYEYTSTNIDFSKKVLQFTTISFDVCYQEIFSTLLCGGQLYIIQDEVRKSVLDMLKFIDDNQIRTVFLPPSYLKLIISDESILVKLSKHIQHIVIAGEQLILTDIFVKYLENNGVYLHNHYGPSETHVATVYTIKPDSNIPKLPPIGKPIANTRIYIVDKNKALVPFGATGELMIAGDCVGRGYLNSRELTAEKFVCDPHLPGSRMYKTGDLARWLADGNLEFLGRADNQVKIRGFRIELGEIESLLLNYDPVKEVAVIPCTDDFGNKFLYSYYVSEHELSIQELREYIGSKLPEYMIPAGFMWLKRMPMTPNGKINRKALPKPMLVADTISDKYEAARNSTDAILIEAWSKVLNNNKIGINDNFFELGGDSLIIIQIQVKLLQYNLGLTIQDFYKYQTIKQLSDYAANFSEAAVSKETVNTNAYNTQITVPKVIPLSVKIAKNNLKDGVLITGATGYLGIHILNDVLSMTNSRVYCLVRGKNSKDAENRLYGLLNYYFPKKYNKNDTRITIVNGDVSTPQFGLSIEEYANVGGNTGMIIHSAALVKHYGNYNESEKVNVTGVREVLEFASSFGCTLNHVSTIGISGNNYLVKQDSDNNVLFTENDFYIGQNYSENVYIRSKFEAERIIFDAIDAGVNVAIYRIGNLTGRYSDGVFQYNIKQNAFYGKLRSLIMLGAVPENLLAQNLEFTPVDYCSRSIVELACNASSLGKVFHIYNHNKISMESFINVILSLNYNVKIMELGAFKNFAIEASDDIEKQAYLSGIIEDFDQRALEYKEFCTVDSSITQQCLKECNFTWPIIDKDYIKKIIAHMRITGFLS